MELWELIPQIGKRDLEEKVRKKLAGLAVHEALEGIFLINEIPKLIGHKNVETLLRDTVKKITEIAKEN